MFLLDTNVVSELRPGKRHPAAAVRKWAATVPAEALYLSAITVLELEIGVLLIERRDPQQASAFRLWLSDFLLQFRTRLLPFSTHTAMLCAAMHVPNPRPERDAMIAATAKEYGYIVVTRNTDDFSGCGVPLLNPWQADSRGF